MLEISWLTLKVSGTATFVSVLLESLELLALADFLVMGYRASLILGLAASGSWLMVSIFLAERSLRVFGDNLFAAMIIAQAIIAAPVVTSC